MIKAVIWILRFKRNPESNKHMAYEQQQARISRPTG